MSLYGGISEFHLFEMVPLKSPSTDVQKNTQSLNFICAFILGARRKLVPVCKYSKGAISLDDGAHHADLLGPEELQGQRLAGQQHHGRVGQHRDGLAAVVVVDRTAVKLLHV